MNQCSKSSLVRLRPKSYRGIHVCALFNDNGSQSNLGVGVNGSLVEAVAIEFVTVKQGACGEMRGQ